MQLSYNDFHNAIGNLVGQLRRSPFIPRYIIAQKDGLIAASFIARRLQYHPVVIDLKELRTSSLSGNVLLLSMVADEQQKKVYETLQHMCVTVPNIRLQTAAVVEQSFQVHFSALQMPEEPGMPWEV